MNPVTCLASAGLVFAVFWCGWEWGYRRGQHERDLALRMRLIKTRALLRQLLYARCARGTKLIDELGAWRIDDLEEEFVAAVNDPLPDTVDCGRR
jgi:hypothetical protein